MVCVFCDVVDVVCYKFGVIVNDVVFVVIIEGF